MYYTICPQTNRKEETDSLIARLHIITRSFLLKGEEPPMYIRCGELLTIKHILLTSSDFIETRESQYSSVIMYFIWRNLSGEDC